MIRRRLDAELVRRGLARSREQAAQLIGEGRVRVAGQTAGKAATQVEAAAAIVVDAADSGPDYVSRGGHKLAGALEAFTGLDPKGRRCLDAGASTGGFTDVLLRAGAQHVVGVDVGYGQIAWSLRTDDRVTVVERLNIRELTPEHVAAKPGGRRDGAGPDAGPGGPPGELPSLVVADLSFISLKLVLAPIQRCVTPDADYVMMVKPQFEVGRERVGTGGVVRDPELRAAAVRDVAGHAWTLGLGVRGVTASPLPGPSGNVEYFLWFQAGAPPLDEADLSRAVAEGPR
ncbi:MAG: rRNA (cytidine1920-2-O)/16S rRNA (cytidine1409-2-O)-methyltransferase [Streptosporangiaceae bacterium]|jgi:23S rRNA (cytidine1920-2'-O)/16S rRNA (cytidine1409-2'-O)-methyltransferase|nr:hemolysin [Streptosporangiaceae bacterium]MDX6429800.1 rRNA (cytidine1920-2-O)/16S rRNA (cytidine1409-2-O)-methyltransferase [Streptosporangiaceae bacterium]